MLLRTSSKLVSLILVQMARQENALLDIPQVVKGVSVHNREELRLEAMDVSGTVIKQELNPLHPAMREHHISGRISP